MPYQDIAFTAFLATTLDGYIARPDGGMDFLDAANATMSPGEDCGISSYLRSVDAIVMGRTTFQHVLGMKDKGGWMYGDLPLFVMSGTMEELPAGCPQSVELVKTREIDSISTTLNEHWQENIVNKSSTTGRTRDNSSVEKTHKVYVDGGEMVRSFIKARMLTEITITIIPRLIGDGRSLFGSTQDVGLELKKCQHWDFGFVQLKYELRYSD